MANLNGKASLYNYLGVLKHKEFGETDYYLVDNDYDKKTLLFNKVKTIDLNDHDRGEKPLSKEEKIKRNLIKKIPNKKLQVAIMDPDIYYNNKLFKRSLEGGGKGVSINQLIQKFNYRMSYYGFDDFLRIKY